MNTDSAELPTNPLSPKPNCELFFGLVGPVGADLSLVCQTLTDELRKVSYNVEIIRLSSLIRNIDKYKDLTDTPEDIRINKHMDAGTEIREKTEFGGILPMMAVARVRQFRQEKSGEANKPIDRQAYIFISLKHPEEVKTLRDIYGGLFFLISCFSPRSTRVDALSKRIAESRNDTNPTKYRDAAERLVNKDEEEEGKKLGQDVTDAFPMADFFVDSRNRKQIKEQMERFIEILFGYPFHTPTKNELGMYFARSSALRSADLSRQVGAALSDANGAVISTGCNDVPSFGGGLYWPGEKDYRDFQKGFDSSTKYKRSIIKEVIDKLCKANLLSGVISGMESSEAVDWIVDGPGRKKISGAEIFNLLEFGRPVHAEMAAITDAARRGILISNSILYVTTFPCHMCARHIISSGIKKVVYIEPYPKSKVKDLYDDEIAIEEDYSEGRLIFTPFVGISPRRFQDFFEILKRKDDIGNKIEWRRQKSSPRVQVLALRYLYLEANIVDFFEKILRHYGYAVLS